MAQNVMVPVEIVGQEGGIGEPKKRVSANKKERRRTQSINNAFTDLRNRIPQIPTDTKLSKIKTLKLAINYIEHLMKLLQENDPTSFEPFKPDLGKLRRECRSREIKVNLNSSLFSYVIINFILLGNLLCILKKSRLLNEFLIL